MGYTSSDHTNTFTAGVAVQRGHLSDLSGDIHFAHNSAVGTTYETIWSTGGLYVWPDTALPLTVASTAGAADAGVQILIDGVDSAYQPVHTTVMLNATGTATTTASFLRVNHTHVTGVQAPTGNIRVRNNGVIVSEIVYDDNTSLKSVFTVPAGYNAYVMSAFISIDKNQELVARLRYRTSGEVWQTSGMISVFGNSFQRDFVIPPMLPPTTDFEIQARAGSGSNNGVSAGFELLLEKI